jgi:succinate dehydrogenase assembly factor 1
MARLSGVQKDVLSLYRRVLRAAVEKDRSVAAAEAGDRLFVSMLQSRRRDDHDRNQQTSTLYAAAEFRRQAASVKRSDFKKIEYMLRKGEKQIKLLQMPGVKVVGGTKL